MAVAALLLPTAVKAQTTAYAAGQGSPNQITLQVQVQASVGGRCGFAATALPSGSFDQPDFDVTGFTHDFPFALECTGPSRVAVVSSNGGLLTGGTAPAGYAVKAPYDVALHLVGEGGNADASCPVATLVADGSCSFRGPATTGQGLRLAASSIGQAGTYIRVSAPAYAATEVLAAGRYADTLIVTVSIAP
jgi:spore coat protein U-like protein